MMNVADLVNPKTGLTYRQENSQLTHSIPIGAIVECLPYNDDPEKDYNEHTGLRLFVVEHNRDCDGTPLYSLSSFTLEEIEEHKNFIAGGVFEKEGMRMRAEITMKMYHRGFSETALKLIKPPKEQVST